MAGMLPGVESARRRRVHQSGETPGLGTHGWTRRSSFCLYATHPEAHHTSNSSLLQRSILNQTYMDEKLGVEAREAKGRLDERLRTQRKSEPKRHNGKKEELKRLHKEGYGSTEKSSGSKRFSWAKLSWKASEQDECAVCLENFRAGEPLVHLPCAHRFHSGCMVPWLENNAHCPCCRMGIA